MLVAIDSYETYKVRTSYFMSLFRKVKLKWICNYRIHSHMIVTLGLSPILSAKFSN